MSDEDELLCILVAYPDGSRVWTPAREYYSNPVPNTFVVRERAEYPRPVVKDVD